MMSRGSSVEAWESQHERWQRDDDLALRGLLPLYQDAQLMLRRLQDRVTADMLSDDHAQIRWLHKRIVAIERDAQKREA